MPATNYSNWEGHLDENGSKNRSKNKQWSLWNHSNIWSAVILKMALWPTAHSKEKATLLAECTSLAAAGGQQELLLIVLNWCLFHSSLLQRKSQGEEVHRRQFSIWTGWKLQRFSTVNIFSPTFLSGRNQYGWLIASLSFFQMFCHRNFRELTQPSECLFFTFLVFYLSLQELKAVHVTVLVFIRDWQPPVFCL